MHPRTSSDPGGGGKGGDESPGMSISGLELGMSYAWYRKPKNPTYTQEYDWLGGADGSGLAEWWSARREDEIYRDVMISIAVWKNRSFASAS